MHQRKKNQNKQNFRAIKKTTLQQINYTQQLHIPTFATMQLRQAGRSIELKKSSSKKPASRKSRCISVKQAGPQPPLNIKQLLKQFKSMKLIRSRSKSPRSSKSKQKSRKSSKRITQTQVNSKSNSELNLTAKLERTLQKLKESNYFPDQQDSQIPLVSTSDAFTQQQKKKMEYIFSGQNFQDINIRELRLFCKNKQPGIKMNLDYFKGNIYEIMARRIQRAWRRYRTHKLVQRYTNILNQHFHAQREQSSSSSESPRNNSQASRRDQEQLMISSDQLYPQQIQRKITYISNLEEESDQHKESQKYESEDATLYLLKKQQLEKWNELITMIKSNRTENPQQTEKLLQKLMNTSEINRRNLQLRPKSNQRNQKEYGEQYEGEEEEEQSRIMDHQSKRNMKNNNQKRLTGQEYTNLESEPEKQLQKLKKKLQQQKSNVSQQSIKQIEEQFNSKKYIEYLDSDMYPIANHHKQSLTTIGKKKQDALLSKLQGQNSKKGLIKGTKILDPFQTNEPKSRLSYRSNSEVSSMSSIEAQQLKSSRRIRDSRILQAQFKKSTSQKNIKYSQYSNSKSKNYEIFEQKEKKQDQVSIQSRQNQVSTDQIVTTPIEKEKKRSQIKILELPQKPRKGLEQDSQCLMRRELEDMEDDAYQFILENPISDNNEKNEKAYLEDEFKKQIEQLHKIRQQDSDDEAQNRNENQPILQRSSKTQLQKVSIQDYDHNIESDEQNSESGQIEKGQTISEMLTNSLIIQFLIEMAKYPNSVLKSFKSIAIKKPKLKRAPTKSKKNGFLTNQAQIKGFIQELCNYVINEEPQIFKNLQKATGPSALQMLRYMHQTVQSDIYIEEEEDDPSIMILPNWIFENFWNRKVLTIKYERQGLEQERQKQRQQYLKGLNKIFLRSCFDCLNQCLDYQRNYGPFGKPFPWKKSHYFDHVKTLQETKKSVVNSQKRLFDISSTYCGIIIEKQEIASLGGNEEYISQVQQDRLSRMLAQDLVQGEQRWIFYDDQETELLVEASNTIFHQLIEQVLIQLNPISRFCFFP